MGIGLVCLPGLEAAVAAGRAYLAWVEIEPQVSWLPDRGVESILQSGPVLAAGRCEIPILLHSVSAPVGGTVPPPQDQVELLARLVIEFGCPWISEHLSILRIPDAEGPVSTGVLLAPPQTTAAVDVAATNIAYLREGVGVPVAFETGVNYLKPRAGEIADGPFFRAVAEAADCGILLDLHNLWCNEQNGRQSAQEVIAALPIERVWEIHVAGGYWRDGHYLDAHSGPTDDPVLDLLAAVVPTLPNLQAVVFEVSPDRIGPSRLTIKRIVEHVNELVSIVEGALTTADEHRELNNTGPIERPLTTLSTRSPDIGTAPGYEEFRNWEQAMGRLVLGRDIRGGLAETLLADAGQRVWRHIAQASRRGQLAGVLPHTVRLLILTFGEAEILKVLDDVWTRTPPAETSAQEMEKLAPHLRTAWGEVPFFTDVLNYELALHRCALRPDMEHAIEFPYDPAQIFGAIAAGALPEHPEPAPHVIVLPARVAVAPVPTHRQTRTGG